MSGRVHVGKNEVPWWQKKIMIELVNHHLTASTRQTLSRHKTRVNFVHQPPQKTNMKFTRSRTPSRQGQTTVKLSVNHSGRWIYLKVVARTETHNPSSKKKKDQRRSVHC